MHVHYPEPVQRGPCPPGEPTGNLDGENTRIVMEILRRLAHEEGRCVTAATHAPEAADTADLVLRMKDGCCCHRYGSGQRKEIQYGID